MITSLCYSVNHFITLFFIQPDRDIALEKVKEFADLKEDWEKKLYGRFVIILNSKKERIRVLEEDLGLYTRGQDECHIIENKSECEKYGQVMNLKENDLRLINSIVFRTGLNFFIQPECLFVFFLNETPFENENQQIFPPCQL